jgi:hypothetical protein
VDNDHSTTEDGAEPSVKITARMLHAGLASLNGFSSPEDLVTAVYQAMRRAELKANSKTPHGAENPAQDRPL